MIPAPSRRSLAAVALLVAASFGLLILPGAWPALAALDAGLLLAALVDLAVSPRPAVLTATRKLPERMAVLGTYSVEVRIENRSKIRLWVRLRDSMPESFGDSEREHAIEVLPRGAAACRYVISPRRRGCFHWGTIYLRYRSLFGFWDRDVEQTADMESRVYPNLDLLERYHLLARSERLAAIGIRRVRFRGGGSEFESLREYTRGDDVRQVDWKATARRGKLTVRHREAERHQTVILLVDCGRLMNAEEDGVSKLDHAVNAALLLANVALARGDRVGLCSFSGKVHSWLAPRGNNAQNRLIGETLFDLAGDFSESDHGRTLKFLAARHSKRSLLVVLTDFVDATTAADMVAHVSLASRRHVVLFAALKDPFLERAAVFLPPTEREAFRKAAAIDLLRERQEVLERIRHAGGLVIDAEPGAITPPIINGYLEVMFGGLL
ncbi:MAG TPA: DUF58 domain-containing protein [Urbifossiella sp.]|jgi:uncharacterized protein (DUF58 family)